jgi:hypothetical protein
MDVLSPDRGLAPRSRARCRPAAASKGNAFALSRRKLRPAAPQRAMRSHERASGSERAGRVGPAPAQSRRWAALLAHGRTLGEQPRGHRLMRISGRAHCAYVHSSPYQGI